MMINSGFNETFNKFPVKNTIFSGRRTLYTGQMIWKKNAVCKCKNTNNNIAYHDIYNSQKNDIEERMQQIKSTIQNLLMNIGFKSEVEKVNDRTLMPALKANNVRSVQDLNKDTLTNVLRELKLMNVASKVRVFSEKDILSYMKVNRM